MTEQEVYNHVCTHLLTQQKKSFGLKPRSNYNDCLYRGPEGTMCAAGCLIDDIEYNSNMEGIPVRYVYKPVDKFPNRIKTNALLVSRLQMIHDNNEVHEWRDKLIQVGELHKLDTRIPYAFA